VNITTDLLLEIALGAALVALVPLCALVALFAIDEFIRRFRHWDWGKAKPREIISATLLGQKVEFAAQASTELVETVAGQRAELDRIEAVVARLGVRLAQLEKKGKGAG